MAIQTPIVVDLGKIKKKDLKELKKGGGPIAGEVEDAVRQVRASLGADAAGKELVPVVVVYRRDRRQRMVLPIRI